jgi:hypothetical protein
MATLKAAKEHTGNGRPKDALRAFSRIYAGWALSQDFYRANLHAAQGLAGMQCEVAKVETSGRGPVSHVDFSSRVFACDSCEGVFVSEKSSNVSSANNLI